MPYAVGSWKSRREKRKVLPRSVDYTGKKKATGTQDAAQSRVEETKQWIEEEERGQSSLRLHPLAGFFVVPRGGFADPFLGGCASCLSFLGGLIAMYLSCRQLAPHLGRLAVPARMLRDAAASPLLHMHRALL